MTHPALHPDIIVMFAIIIKDGKYYRMVSPIELEPVDERELIQEVCSSYKSLQQEHVTPVEQYMFSKMQHFLNIS
jgi:hypothetical protein